jgi:hypothetical protein
MKILTKHKIVESFHFPFSEALIFSILLWSSWGLAEAFYWDRISGMIDSTAPNPTSFIYLQAFLIYVAIAAFTGTLIYAGMRILLAAFQRHNTITFRAVTLCVILGLFFSAAIFFGLSRFVWRSSFSQNSRYTIAALLIGFCLLLLGLLYRWASGDEFRIRRSGTMMLSILVISVLLSFVDFPIFSASSTTASAEHEVPGYQRLMAYYYLKPLLH